MDSTRLLRTNNCDDPCNAPPNWPAASDTLRTVRVGYRYDRAGHDSLRINDRGKATLYLHDRLGRRVSRRPWTDSMAVRDSLVYDIAGNLRKTIARRGDTIVTTYDTRNRDTLTIIPGVGNLRKTFGGPLDQLTRLWYDTPVDSIGGVNAELRWTFDQRGRLKADTSYTGSQVRLTSYAYDTYERVSQLTNAVGTWTTRFEASRGYPDTLLTPLGDTVSYTWDARGRPVGPVLRGGGPVQSMDWGWDQTGALITHTSTVATTPNYVSLKYDRQKELDDPMPPAAPIWTRMHGSTAALDSLRDSLTYDGWNRLTAMVSFRNDTVIVRDTFAFDRTGNIRTTAGAEVYDPTTDRLLSRTDTCGTWSYGYDRAGNVTSAACSSVTWTYGYDALNQLRSVRQNGTLIARYGYDVQGRRIAKRVYSSATGGTVAYTRFVYQGSHVSFETDSAGTLGLRYTWGLGTDVLVAIQDASGNHFYLTTDQLGSVRAMVRRSNGAWVRGRRFGAYGALVEDASKFPPSWDLRYRWTGREYDAETGFYYFRARYYDVAQRRFVQEDPIGHAGGINVYAYGDGEPLAGRDPSGLRMNTQVGFQRTWQSRWSRPMGKPRSRFGRGGGDFWSWLDGHTAYVDMMWEYADYLNNYQMAIQAIVEGFRSTGQFYNADRIEQGSEPLSVEEWANASGAIEALFSNDVTGFAVNPVAVTLNLLLSQGRVFFNELILKETELGWSSEAGGDNFVVLRGNVANGDQSFLRHVFAHEWVHWENPTWNEERVDETACMFSGYRSPPCRP